MSFEGSSPEWHYTDSTDADCGPVSLDELKAQYANGVITMQAFMWHPEIMADASARAARRPVCASQLPSPTAASEGRLQRLWRRPFAAQMRALSRYRPAPPWQRETSSEAREGFCVMLGSPLVAVASLAR